MERTLIKNLPKFIGKIVKIQGFVDAIRNQKRIQFLILKDRTGKIQTVHTKSDSGNDMISEIISSLSVESTVSIIGKAIKAPQVKLGGIEVQIKSLTIESKSATPLPITPQSALDKQIDWRQISLRTSENLLIFQTQTTMEHAMREYWAKDGFIEIHSPKLMAAATESGSELFSVPYFNNWTACLAQSPQFYKQMAMAAGLDRVFEIGPVFRANPSFTSRHDTEFTSVDMEISWIDSHENVMQLEEKWLRYVLSIVAKKHGAEIKKKFGALITVPSIPFPRISLAEARNILKERGHIIEHKADLDPQGERLISDYVAKQYQHEFVFIVDYPAAVRPFYHMCYPDKSKLTMSFDLLWKGLEITTGAQREHRIEKLSAQAKEKGIQLESLEHYFNFFKYGCPPHGGCGVGLTRLLMALFGRSNVREVTFLYRGPNRLTP